MTAKTESPRYIARVTIESSTLGTWVQHVKLTVDECRNGAESAASIAVTAVKQCINCHVVSVDLAAA